MSRCTMGQGSRRSIIEVHCPQFIGYELHHRELEPWDENLDNDYSLLPATNLQMKAFRLTPDILLTSSPLDKAKVEVSKTSDLSQLHVTLDANLHGSTTKLWLYCCDGFEFVLTFFSERRSHKASSFRVNVDSNSVTLREATYSTYLWNCTCPLRNKVEISVSLMKLDNAFPSVSSS